MLDEAQKFGFNSQQFTPVRSAASNFDKNMNASQTALSSIGQYDTATTPLQMAMVASAIADNGTLMQPYMVDSLQSPSLDTVAKTQPKKLSQPLSPENAQKLQSMMETVVQKGTGTMAQIPGVTVGGKTGTAQHGVDNSGKPYAWFVSYAKTGSGSPIAIAVVVEDSAANRADISGGGLAAPIAKSVMEAVINSKN
jgi:peptidoglycan glycosyltransferase